MTEQQASEHPLKNYGKLMVAGAPAALLRSASGAPSKVTETTVEDALTRVANKLPRATLSETSETVKRGLKRAAVSGTTGFAAGALTLPLFVKSSKMLASDDPRERKRGAALMAAQGLVFSAVKSVPDSTADHYLKHGPQAFSGAAKSATTKAIAHTVKGRLAAAAAIGVPSLVLTSAAVAAQRRKERNNPESYNKKHGYLVPALVGAGTGVAGGLIESAVEEASKRKALTLAGQAASKLDAKDFIRLAGPKAGAYGAAGLVSGLIAKPITDYAVKKLSKHKVVPAANAGVGV
jgi:hypothetical protein